MSAHWYRLLQNLVAPGQSAHESTYYVSGWWGDHPSSTHPPIHERASYCWCMPNQSSVECRIPCIWDHLSVCRPISMQGRTPYHPTLIRNTFLALIPESLATMSAQALCIPVGGWASVCTEFMIREEKTNRRSSNHTIFTAHSHSQHPSHLNQSNATIKETSQQLSAQLHILQKPS